MIRVAAVAIVAVLASSGAASADTVTIDFEGMGAKPLGSNPGYRHTTTYTEDGFTFSTTVSHDHAMASWTADAGPYYGAVYTGSYALFSNYHTPVFTSAGGTFDLLSIDLASITTTGTHSGSFVGTRADATVVTQSYSFSTPGLRTLSFSGFTNLTSVTFNVGSDQFDNMVVIVPDAAAVPLPGAAAAGVVLMGLVGAKRFRRPGRDA